MNVSIARLDVGALAISRRRLRLSVVAILLLVAMTVAFGAGRSAPSRDATPLIGEMVVTATRLG